MVEQALVVDLPDQPPECGRPEKSGVKEGDRLDIALVKTDGALTRANAKGATCAAWYRDLKTAVTAATPRPM